MDRIRESEQRPRPRPGTHPAQAPRSHPLRSLQSSAGNRAVTGFITRAAGGSRANPPAPEATPLNATGHYEAREPGRGNRITLQLNQAGKHLHGWFQHHRPQGENRPEQIVLFRIEGEIIASDSTSLRFAYARLDSTGAVASWGELIITGSGDHDSIVLNEGRWRQSFDRIDRAARLSSAAIETMPAATQGLVRSAETAPLDAAESALVDLTAHELHDLIEQWHANIGMYVTRGAAANRLDRRVGEMFAPLTSPQQRPMAVRRLQARLLQDVIPLGSTERTAYDWLQSVVSLSPQYTPRLQGLLGLRPSGESESTRHHYRYMMSLHGYAGGQLYGLGGGAYLGIVTIEKMAPDRWTATYYTLVGELSAGAGKGFGMGQMSDWTEFDSDTPWTPANFRGLWFTAGVQATAAFGGGRSRSPGGIIAFEGDGTWPALTVPAGGGATALGLQAGAGITGQAGYLWATRAEAIRHASSQQQEAVTGAASYGDDRSVHFRIDDPSLTDSGRALLRETVGEHLAAFRNASSTLAIDGYASPSGPESRNETLARLRAQNVLQAIRDILGNQLEIPQRNIRVDGHGEVGALRAGVPQGQESEPWRRVDVRLNGSVVLMLR